MALQIAGFAFEQETEPQLHDTTFEESNVFLLLRREGSMDRIIPLFIRESLVRLWKEVEQDFWKKEGKKELYVKGSPGCGKTCFFLLWARLLSKTENKRALIVQHRLRDASFIYIREAGGNLFRLKDPLWSRRVEGLVLRKILEDGGLFDLCIHDGYHHAETRQVESLLNSVVGETIAKIVYVTSLGVSFESGDGWRRGDDDSNKVIINVDSWSFQEYKAAVSCHEFVKEMGAQHPLRQEKDALQEQDKDGDDDDKEEKGKGSKKRGSLHEDQDEDEETEAEEQQDDVSFSSKATASASSVAGAAPAAAAAQKTTKAAAAGKRTKGSGSVAGGAATEQDPANELDKHDSHVSWDEVVEAKYFYAGGSARFMFQFKLDLLIKFLDETFERLVRSNWLVGSNNAELLTVDVISTQTLDVVDDLMQQFGGIAVPVSKYILRKAYEHCKTKLVESVRAAADATNNPVLKGWVFELEQIERISLCLQSNRDGKDKEKQFITSKIGLCLCPEAEIKFNEKSLERGSVEDGSVIWCVKWNQGCFDVAFFEGGTLVTLQFTVAAKHSMKPSFIRKLRDELLKKGKTIDFCRHIAVVESAYEKFEFDDGESGAGQSTPSTRDVDFMIDAFASPCLEQIPSTNTPCCFQAEVPAGSGVVHITMYKPNQAVDQAAPSVN